MERKEKIHCAITRNARIAILSLIPREQSDLENRHVHVVLWIHSSVSRNRSPSLLLHISLSASQDACIASLQNCWLFPQPAWSLSTRSSRSPGARNRKWQWAITAPLQDRGARTKTKKKRAAYRGNKKISSGLDRRRGEGEGTWRLA